MYKRQGELRIEIEKESGAFVFWRGAEKITGSGWRDLAYMKTNWKGSAYDKGPEDAYMREQLSISVGELVYGLGERFSAFVKNGQSVDIWNAVSYTHLDVYKRQFQSLVGIALLFIANKIAGWLGESRLI